MWYHYTSSGRVACLTQTYDKARKATLPRSRGTRSVRFDELCKLAEDFGFELVRIKGSHHIYTRAGSPLQDFQPGSDGKAKYYQVQQLLDFIDTLEGEADAGTV